MHRHLCNTWGELSTSAGLHKCLQHEEKGKTQGHCNHGAKSLTTKHRPEIILREFIGWDRCLVHSDVLQLSLQLQSGFRTQSFSVPIAGLGQYSGTQIPLLL